MALALGALWSACEVGAPDTTLATFSGDAVCGGRQGPPVLHIRNGSTQPPLAMSAGQQMAIGKLSIPKIEDGELKDFACTATMITPTWAIGANHCFTDAPRLGASAVDKVSPEDIKFQLSAAADGQIGEAKTFDVSRIVTASELIRRATSIGLPRPEGSSDWDTDLALIELSQDVTEVLPGLQPLQITQRALAPRDELDAIMAAGYGIMQAPNPDPEGPQPPTSSLRRFVPLAFTAIRDNLIVTDGEGERGVCLGDSGGPLLTFEPDMGRGDMRGSADVPLSNNRKLRIVATLFRGQRLGRETCLDQDNWSRVDVFHEVIVRLVGPTGTVGIKGCGDENGSKCANDFQRVLCRDGQRAIEDCRDRGQVCGLRGDRQWDCVDERDDICRGLKPWGRCDGSDQALWCDPSAANPIRGQRCHACPGDQVCDFVSRLGGWHCAAQQ